MKGEDASSGYQIANARIPILLNLRRAKDLKPHEQTVKEDLDKLIVALRGDPVLRHPIITDAETGLVLDGTHRLTALEQLGCNLIPCAELDYQNPSVVVDRWFRETKGATLAEFEAQLEPRRPSRVSPSEAEAGLQRRSCYASLQNTNSCYVLSSNDGDVQGLARSAYEVEEVARRNHLTVIYSDDDSVPTEKNAFLLSTICLRKPEIIASSIAGNVFPPKTTRHIIPSRPLGLNVPLKWLAGSDLKRGREQFTSHLRKLRVRRLPEGAWIGSRRYQEEVFLFE